MVQNFSLQDFHSFSVEAEELLFRVLDVCMTEMIHTPDLRGLYLKTEVWLR